MLETKRIVLNLTNLEQYRLGICTYKMILAGYVKHRVAYSLSRLVNIYLAWRA